MNLVIIVSDMFFGLLFAIILWVIIDFFYCNYYAKKCGHNCVECKYFPCPGKICNKKRK